MKTIFNHKLFEIFFEKALIALILLLAAFVANQSLERYKLIEVQRIAGTTAFVNACQEIWSKVYAYESTINDISSIRFSRNFFLFSVKSKLNATEVEIAKKEKLAKQQLTELQSFINDRKFIIGDKMVLHFGQYVGLVLARADAKNTAQEKEGYEAKISQDAAEVFEERIASMRFTADMAREHAISQLPR